MAKKKKKPEVYRPKLLANKKTFSNRGVIFEVERDTAVGDLAVKMTHWPHCGMDERTCVSFAKWLLKRAKDIKDDRTLQLKLARRRIKGALDLKKGDIISCNIGGTEYVGRVADIGTHGKYGVPVALIGWNDGRSIIYRPDTVWADGRLDYRQTAPTVKLVERGSRGNRG